MVQSPAKNTFVLSENQHPKSIKTGFQTAFTPSVLRWCLIKVEFKQLKLNRIKNGIRELFFEKSDVHETGT